MALTLATVMRDDLANQMDTSINAGAGTSNMKLETSGDVEVATINFQNPAFGAASAGVITLAGTPLSDTNASGGTVAQFSIYDRDNVKQLEGVVAVSGQDLDLSSLSVGAGDTV
ncbi:MAG: hypothetical protein IIB57_03580, partial [Planctomycetes bacterium]|nr:hypothetical protein [Planctomycetota bacterium]